MTSSARLKLNSPANDSAPPDVALLLPWFATGALHPEMAQRVSDAVIADAALANELAAIRAEQAAVAAMGEALARPSSRPLRALFAAIDAQAHSCESFAFASDAAVDLPAKRISLRR